MKPGRLGKRSKASEPFSMRDFAIVLTPVLCACLLTGCADRYPRYAAAPPPPPAVTTVPGRDGVIPSGTQLEIRTLERIDSTSAVDGRTYAAEIAQLVVDRSGSSLIPIGSPA